jgi:hypothetical protein
MGARGAQWHRHSAGSRVSEVGDVNGYDLLTLLPSIACGVANPLTSIAHPEGVSIMPDRVIWHLPAIAWMGAGIGALAASAILLWAYYGSAVFFETIAAGLASCF